MTSVLFVGIALLLVSFLVQLVLWRLVLPGKQTRALLILFTLTPLATLGFLIAAGHPVLLSPAENVRLALLYLSCTLAYIVLYSAIENQSPTLAVVSHLARAGSGGCSDTDLFSSFGHDDTMSSRLAAMERSGWTYREGETLRLTPQGRFYARLFQYGSNVVGLELKGG